MCQAHYLLQQRTISQLWSPSPFSSCFDSAHSVIRECAGDDSGQLLKEEPPVCFELDYCGTLGLYHRLQSYGMTLKKF